MARGKSTGGDKPITRMGAVREALAVLGADAKPPAIIDFVRDNFGLEITPNSASAYKSQILKAAGGKLKKRRGRPPAAAAAPAAAAVTKGEGVPWKDIRTVKEMADRIGVKGLRELVELLA